MDEPLKSILTAIGTILAGGMIALAGMIIGRLNSRKDAAKLAMDTNSQRNRSEETFRSAFAEQKVRSDRLEKQVRYVYKQNKLLTAQVETLTEQVTTLQASNDTLTKHIVRVEKERDDALNLIKEIKQ